MPKQCTHIKFAGLVPLHTVIQTDRNRNSTMNPDIWKALNEQVCTELTGAYFYWHLSNILDGMFYPGMAAYVAKQAKDELVHAQRITKFLLDRDQDVVPMAIKAPNTSVDCPASLFEVIHKNELLVTQLLRRIQLAITSTARDELTEPFVREFVEQQIGEEKESLENFIRVRRAQAQNQLDRLDEEFAKKE